MRETPVGGFRDGRECFVLPIFSSTSYSSSGIVMTEGDRLRMSMVSGLRTKGFSEIELKVSVMVSRPVFVVLKGRVAGAALQLHALSCIACRSLKACIQTCTSLLPQQPCVALRGVVELLLTNDMAGARCANDAPFRLGATAGDRPVATCSTSKPTTRKERRISQAWGKFCHPTSDVLITGVP
jgi:hypothetical protein